MNLIFRFAKSFIFWTLVLCLVLILTPGLPPYDVDFVSPEGPPLEPLKYEGPLKQNELLENAEILSSTIVGSTIGRLKGVESFAVKDGYLYSGVQGGDIVRIPLKDPFHNPWTSVAKVGEPCNGVHEEEKCGRPLGMSFDSKGHLVVADAYYGLYRVNVDTGAKEPLVPSTLIIEGAKNVLTNSLAITNDGKTIYFTTSSSNFDLSDGMFEILAGPSGRVLEYNLESNSSKVLVNGLSFGNGIVLSPKEDFLLYCETIRQRVWKFHLQGEKKGEKELMVTLPGAVDNIKSNGKDGYIVAVVFPSVPNHSNPLLHIKSRDYLCKLLVRLGVLVQKILGGIVDYVYPSPALKMIIHQIGNTEYMGADLLPAYGLVVELNANGEVTRSWHSPSGKVAKISEGFVHDGFMYLGSPYNPYVARIPFTTE